MVFIDARHDPEYKEGHIPGAYQFDHYHPENYIAAVAPVCQKAEQIVVYCAGGKCEDSEYAAIFLRDNLGLPKEKLFVYAGGIGEWTGNGAPVELESRNSAKMRTAK